MTTDSSTAPHHAHGASDKLSSPHFRAMLIGCIGVVYGDIGTSPLYAFREAALHTAEGGITSDEILGIISLIIWSLVIIVTIKYIFFLLRADNNGEGGILSLMALAQKGVGSNMGIVFFAGIIGAALFFGEASVTPAISVLSAVEGTKLITPAFEKYVLPISIAIMIGLFSVQRYGTAHVSKFFGPITLIWFITMGVAGFSWIIRYPMVLGAFSPTYAFEFLFSHGFLSFVVLGSVFLAVTGAEALYSDLGHFGRKPIRLAWIFLVFPCLILNYMGQGALLIATPAAIKNPFFFLVPEWGLIPLVILATMATIIASQAVITGAFSIARQAIQLGLIPRMEIRHTSESQEGQIYIPKVNTLLLYSVILLCVVFGTSTNLAAAYGISVTGTMVVSSIIAFVVLHKVWKKSLALSLAIIAPFICIELVFLSSNLLKLFQGGFVPLLFGVYFVMLVVIWVKGSRFLVTRAQTHAISMIDLVEMLDRNPPHVVPGTAIFMTGDPNYAPETMLQNLKHNQVMHENNIVLSVIISRVPRIPIEQRVQVEKINDQFLKIVLNFGFMETPNVPAALYRARALGYDIDIETASFFAGHKKLVADPHHGLPLWQDYFYIAMAKNAIDATDYFRIPPAQVVEIGTRQFV